MLWDVAQKSGVPATSRRSLGVRGAEKDWTDALLDDFAAIRPRQDMEPYQVTARLSRLALHVARVQEESFGKYGLNRGEVGVLAALRFAGPKQQSSPTRLFNGLMLSSAGITSRLDRLEQPESGRHVLEMAVGADSSRERELVSGLSAAERKSLAALLKKLLSSLEPNSDGG